MLSNSTKTNSSSRRNKTKPYLLALSYSLPSSLVSKAKKDPHTSLPFQVPFLSPLCIFFSFASVFFLSIFASLFLFSCLTIFLYCFFFNLLSLTKSDLSFLAKKQTLLFLSRVELPSPPYCLQRAFL